MSVDVVTKSSADSGIIVDIFASEVVVHDPAQPVILFAKEIIINSFAVQRENIKIKTKFSNLPFILFAKKIIKKMYFYFKEKFILILEYMLHKEPVFLIEYFATLCKLSHSDQTL